MSDPDTFKSARQKINGLGYSLLVFVYDAAMLAIGMHSRPPRELPEQNRKRLDIPGTPAGSQLGIRYFGDRGLQRRT